MITTGTCQIAYFVPDVHAAALRHHQMFGSGPYYVLDEVSLPFCEYRGEPARWSISSAFGQWGDIQVEFMQQNDALPSFSLRCLSRRVRPLRAASPCDHRPGPSRGRGRNGARWP
ncbi:hypothetical protein ACFSTD_18995 [Novosphingobium colocasiae]